MRMIALIILCLFGFTGINGNPVGTCPSTNGLYVDFLTDDSDCNKFYKCNWGTPVLYLCPAGLDFNPTINVCDWPDAAGCGSSPTVPTVPPTSGPTSSPGTGKCSGVSCPAIPGDFPVFHPHPEECGRYCVCDWFGTSHDMPCPDGLHFNPTLDVCDWPANAGCDGSGTGPDPVDPVDPPVTEPPSPGKCTEVTCPAVPGEFPVFYPHPEVCGRYCVCDWGGTVHDMPCPDGLQFNPILDVCDWPENVGCDDSGSGTSAPVDPTDEPTSPPVTSPPDSGKCSGVSCPAVPGDYPVFHPHPEDCGRYCKCDWGGIAHDMPCPDGLHFNPTLDVCDWPAAAGCGDSGSGTTAPVEPTDKPSEPTDEPSEPTDEPSEPTDEPTSPPVTSPPDSGKCIGVSCPAIPGDFPVFHPHPEECGRYCVCDWFGTSHDMPCPDGLHFNPTLDVCDWPANAGCDGSGTGPGPVDPVDPPVTEPPSPGKCTEVTCPAVPGDFPVFYPHPEVCGRYCVCDWGGTVHDMPCPDGLQFNPILDVCDWPENVGCDDSGSGTSAPVDPTDEPTSPPVTSPPDSGKCSGVSCPAVPGDYPVFHPHPEDCGRYCKCDWGGIAHDMPCPDGLHFNPTLDVCDWPSAAGCGDSGSGTTAPVEPTDEPSEPTNIPTDAPTSPPVTSPPDSGKCAVLCPDIPGDYPIFHPHPEECGRYCICDWGGISHDMPCPDGLEFNPILDVCDWAENVDCGDSGSGTSAPVEPTDEPVEPTDKPTDAPTSPPVTSPPDSGKCGVLCPDIPGDYPIFHPHPEECGRYCICDWGGISHDMPCPDGLQFNPILDVCDWAENVDCGDSGSGTSAPVEPTDEPVEPTDKPTDAPTSPPATSPPDSGKCEVLCPDIPGDYPIFHPHPEECGRYCICDWGGIAHDMPCPDGLQFNPILDVCDWPDNVGCGDSGSGTSAPVDPTDEPTEPIDPGTPTSPPATDPPGPSGGCSTVSCPDVPGDYPVFHINPNDCGRYCKCDWGGIAHDMPCPAGLHFNPTLDVCDWPGNPGSVAAGC